MSVFDDKNIESELLVRQVYNISCMSTGFINNNGDYGWLIREYFFKHFYNNKNNNSDIIKEVIDTIGSLPAKLIEDCFSDKPKPLCRKFKRFVKHEYKHKFVYERDWNQVALYIEDRDLNYNYTRIGFIIRKRFV